MIDRNGDRIPNYWVFDYGPGMSEFRPVYYLVMSKLPKEVKTGIKYTRLSELMNTSLFDYAFLLNVPEIERDWETILGERN